MDRRLVFAVGIALGAIGGWWAHPTGASPAPAPPAPRASAPAPAPAPVLGAEAPAAPAECDPAELAKLKLANAVMSAQLGQIGGDRVEWPADPPAWLREDAIRAMLRDVEVPAELLTLDCDEFPCIAYFKYADGQPASSSVMDPLAAAWVERSGRQGIWSVAARSTEHGTYAGVVFEPLAVDEVVDKRTKVRIDDLAETWTQR